MPPKYVKGRRKKLIAQKKKEAELEKQIEAEASVSADSVTAGVNKMSVSGDSTTSAAVSSTASATSNNDADHEADEGFELHRTLMDEAMRGVVYTSATNANKVHPNQRDIKIDKVTLSLFGQDLIHETDLHLNWGNRYGLIGENGSGKTILMSVLGRRMLPMPSAIDSFHVVSEIDPTDMSALEAVLAVDTEKKNLEEEADKLTELLGSGDEEQDEEINDRLCDIYERLDELGADTAEARAARILHGLGFSQAMQRKKTRDFSGGWRMRIALARALFLNPAFLLLDEPTNHLDMEAVVWLENYLANFKKILFFVSHSQDFLNNVCTNIILLRDKKLEYFGGNYDAYIQTREQKEMHQMKRHQWEQDQIKKMKDYIAKFGHGSAKLARQAQSKEKTLAKMERQGLTQAVKSDRLLKFKFHDPGEIPPPVLQLQSLNFAYPNCELLYRNVDFGVDLDSRIALVGPNGAGKTTLLKLIAGELIPTSGNVRPHPHLRMARYTQHFVDTLDLSKSPLDYFEAEFPEQSREVLRQWLGRFGISGPTQMQTMKTLSDGLKSRVVFSYIANQRPHVLLLDEPTNHLDIETIDSLADAINEFEGGMVLVSHDMRLISQVAKEIWECNNKTITRFDGTIESYKAKLSKELEVAAAQFEKERAAGK